MNEKVTSEDELQENEASNDFADPIGVLVSLARSGEIDPWDIDLSQVTEKFLEHIESLESQDLRVPARTLFYASILLRMKSDSMEEEEEILEDEPFEDDFAPITKPKPSALPKPPIRRKTRRPVTLNELISELKKAEKVVTRRDSHKKERRPEESVEKSVDKTHEEGIEDRIRILRTAISEKLEGQSRIAFSDVGKDVLDYVSLLFMAGRREVWLEQEDFFGELYLRRHPGRGKEDLIVES